MKYLFIGEQKSMKAAKMGVSWEDGRLAAKQLFEALEYCGINPKECKFLNALDGTGQPNIFRSYGSYQFVAMGNRVAKWLTENGMDDFIKIVHPAARGKIRLKANYFAHVKSALSKANGTITK